MAKIFIVSGHTTMFTNFPYVCFRFANASKITVDGW